MIIWGKLTGAIIGFLLYGPIGVVLGLIFGHIFDNGLAKVLTTTNHGDKTREVFFRVAFQVIGYISKATGRVSENEIRVARDIMINDFQLNNSQMNLAIRYFNQGKSLTFNLNSALQEFKKNCGAYVDLQKFFLEIIVKASLANGMLASEQRTRLIFICGYLGIPLAELDYLIKGYTGTFYGRQSGPQPEMQSQQTNAIIDAYNLLEVSPDATDKVISLAYRRLVSKYHPDKLMAKGVPPEMLNIAKEKTQKIIAAYDLIMQHRGK